MKTSKEKAKELVNRFKKTIENWEFNGVDFEAKQCALICVERELKLLHNLKTKLYKELGADSFNERCRVHDLIDDLKEVEQEIKKM